MPTMVYTLIGSKAMADIHKLEGRLRIKLIPYLLAIKGYQSP